MQLRTAAIVMNFCVVGTSCCTSCRSEREISRCRVADRISFCLTLLSFAAVYALMVGRLEALRMTAVTAEGCLLVGGYLISSTRSG